MSLNIGEKLIMDNGLGISYVKFVKHTTLGYGDNIFPAIIVETKFGNQHVTADELFYQKDKKKILAERYIFIDISTKDGKAKAFSLRCKAHNFISKRKNIVLYSKYPYHKRGEAIKNDCLTGLIGLI